MHEPRTLRPGPQSVALRRARVLLVIGWSAGFGVASGLADGAIADVLYHLAVWPAVVVALWPLARRGVERPWRLIGAGIVLFALGDAAWDLIELGGGSPNASWADVVYLLGYLAIATGVAVRLRTHGGSGRRDGLLDGLLLAVPAAVLAVQFLVTPSVEAAGTTFEQVVAAAYPLADTMLVAAFVWLLVTPGLGRRVVAPLALGMATTMVVDTAWAAASLAGDDELLRWCDSSFPLTYALLALGVAAAATAPPVPAPPSRPLVPWGRVLLLGGGLVASPTAAAVAASYRVEVHPGIVVAGTLLAAWLVVVRFVGLVNRLNRTTQELSDARNELLARSLRDPLTGCYNRRALDERLEGLGDAGPGDALVSIDLDRFKAVNDLHGHQAGDTVLEAVARRLGGCTRADDAVIRMGGDEFLVVLRGVDEATAGALAGRMVASVEEPVAWAGGQLRISASAGVVTVDPGRSGGTEELLHEADAAMYGAKRHGGGAVHLAGRATTV